MKLKLPLPLTVCATLCNTGGMNTVDVVRGPRFVLETNIRYSYVI